MRAAAVRPRRFLLGGLAVAIGAPALTVVLFLVVVIAPKIIADWRRFDKSSQDYLWFQRELFGIAKSTRSNRLDLATLNGGEWSLACLFGPYNDPEQTLRGEAGRLGLQVKSSDSLVSSPFGGAPVEAGENAAAYLRPDGHIKIILLNDFVASEHKLTCVRREQRVILLNELR